MDFFNQVDMKFFQSLLDSPWSVLINVLDIIIVTWLIYRLIKSLIGTKVMSLVNGVLLFFALRLLTGWIGLKTLTYLMDQIITYGVIAGLVIFTPEIRSALEKFGRTTKLLAPNIPLSDEEKLVMAITKAISYMSPRKIGALIAVERTQTLAEYIATGISVNADVSKELLINIFIPNTPLHDGAVIISQAKLVSACSYLPLSESPAISKAFGTRHRAALGLAEQSDAIVIVVSEETGAISLMQKGEFLHDLSVDDFELILTNLLKVSDMPEIPRGRWWKKVKRW